MDGVLDDVEKYFLGLWVEAMRKTIGKKVFRMCFIVFPAVQSSSAAKVLLFSKRKNILTTSDHFQFGQSFVSLPAESSCQFGNSCCCAGQQRPANRNDATLFSEFSSWHNSASYCWSWNSKRIWKVLSVIARLYSDGRVRLSLLIAYSPPHLSDEMIIVPYHGLLMHTLSSVLPTLPQNK